MGRAEGVVFALDPARKAGNAAELAQSAHLLTAPGQDLVRVSLVPDVPHQTIVRRIEYIVQRDSKFNRAQIRRQVATGLGHRIEQESAQFRDQNIEVAAR